jgi:hypothetical protein
MTNQLYTSLSAAVVTYNVSIQDLTLTGVYNLVATYTWGGTGAVMTSSVSFTLTL